MFQFTKGSVFQCLEMLMLEDFVFNAYNDEVSSIGTQNRIVVLHRRDHENK